MPGVRWARCLESERIGDTKRIRAGTKSRGDMKFTYQRMRHKEEISDLTEEELKKYEKKIYIPSLLVCLRHNNEISRRCFALVDSGADMVTAGYKFARDLGLDPVEGKEGSVQGPWGTRPRYIYENIEVVILRDINGLRTLRFTTRIGFCDAVGNQIVLGREGFFDTFKVMMNEKHREIELIIPRGRQE